MSSNITVNPSTTLILLKNQSPTYVYLPTLNTNDFEITVRDITGSSALTSNPAIISTTSGARFLDGTTSYAINQPYGLANIALRTSSIWQILHTSGQQPANSAANIDTLNISSLYVSLHSSFEKHVSSMLVENLFTPNSITIAGSLVIDNFSSIGSITILSTLNVYNDVTTFGNVYVSGNTSFLSSVFIDTIAPTNYDITGLSSLGVAGGIYVKNNLDIYSTLTLRSTIQVDTLQVTLSSTQYSLTTQNLLVAGYISTLSNYTANLSTVVNRNLIVQKEATIGGTLTTKDLVIQGTSIVEGSVSSLGNAIFLSSLRVEGAAFLQENSIFASTLTTSGTLFTPYFSTPSLSTFSSLVLDGTLSNTSSFTVLGNLSSYYLNSLGNMSVGNAFHLPGSLSTFYTNALGGSLNVDGDSKVGSIFGMGTLGVGNTLHVNESTIVDDIRVFKDFTTGGNATVGSLTQVAGDLGVGSSIFVTGDLKINGTAFISTFTLNSYLLSNLRILTSSPFTSFTASTINASTINTGITQINVNELSLSSVFASTLIADTAILNKANIDSLYADKAYFNILPSTGAIFDNYDLFVNGTSYFFKGLSTNEFYTNTATGGTFTGIHIGSGNGLSNIPFGALFLSTPSTIASTITTVDLNTSTFTTGVLTIYKSSIIQSSIVFPNDFAIQGIGYPLLSNYEQILMLSPSTMVINNTMFFDRENNFIGINVSSPQYELDLGDGSLTAVSLTYSSVTQGTFSSIQLSSPVEFSLLKASSIFVRDGHSTTVLYVGADYNNSNGLRFVPNSIDLLEANGYLEIYQEASSIGVGKGFHIYDTRKVGINTVNWVPFFTSYDGTVYQPLAPLEVYSNARIVNTYTSTTDTTVTFQTSLLKAPNLNLYAQIPPATTSNLTNEIYTYESTISLNNSMYVLTSNANQSIFGSSVTTAVGILTSTPLYTLHVMGNAFFSSLYATTLTTNTLSYSYKDI